jgi:hypothetical protein
MEPGSLQLSFTVFAAAAIVVVGVVFLLVSVFIRKPHTH